MRFVSQWMIFVSMFGTIGVLIALFYKSKSYPLNYGLLSLFTLLEGHAVGTIGKLFSHIKIK
jgi:FtsH-binding integral membrane protein